MAMLDIDYKKEFSSILEQEQIDWFFAYSIRHIMNHCNELLELEPALKDYAIMNIFLDITQQLFNDNILDEFITSELQKRIVAIFSLCLEASLHDEGNENQTLDYIDDYAQFIEYSHLAILSTFKNHNLLGREKRNKLIFLMAFPEYRGIAIKKRLDQLQSHRMINDISEPILIRSDFVYAHNGMLDPALNDFVESTLIIPQLVKRFPHGKTMAITITSKGIEYVNDLLEKSDKFRIFYNIAKDLSIFDDMGAEELARFIKNEVIEGHDKKVKGAFYGEGRMQ